MSDLGDRISDTLRKIFGQKPRCANGARDPYTGLCVCQEHFKGDLCEEIVCLNGGNASQRINAHDLYETLRCVCIDYKHYSGLHCQKLMCENGGTDNGKGVCRCPSTYSGVYCETYNNPLGIIIGSVAGVLFCLLMFWMICQWYVNKKQTEQFDDNSESPYRFRNRYRNNRNGDAVVRRESVERLASTCSATVGPNISPSVELLPPPEIDLAGMLPPPSYEEAMRCAALHPIANNPTVERSNDCALPKSGASEVERMQHTRLSLTNLQESVVKTENEVETVENDNTNTR